MSRILLVFLALGIVGCSDDSSVMAPDHPAVASTDTLSASTLELAATPPLQAPAGFQPLVEVRVTPPAGDAAIRRATLEHP